MKLHTTPSAIELIAAVREFLQDHVMPATEGQLSFHARVAANVLRTVERELAADDADEWATARLHSIGAVTETDLTDKIQRANSLDELGDVIDVLDALTRARLDASNPNYLVDVTDDDPTRTEPAPEGTRENK